MKFIKILTGLILTAIVCTPLATGAKEFNTENGAGITGGVYISGNGSYISAYDMCQSSDPNIKEVSASIETINSTGKSTKTSIGKNKAEVYVIGGAGNTYVCKLAGRDATSEVVVEEKNF